MNIFKCLSIVFFALVLAACGSTDKPSTTLKQDSIRLNTANNGYLLIAVDTTHNLKSIEIEGASKITISHKDLEQGSNFILVPAKPGLYNIRRIYLGDFRYFRFDDEEMWSFELTEQTISYVGHLEMSLRLSGGYRSRIELVNRSTEAVDFLRKNFPNILNSKQLVYGGPGEDPFFDFLFKRTSTTKDNNAYLCKLQNSMVEA